MSRPPRRGRPPALRIALTGVVLWFALSGCNEIEAKSGSAYHPAELSSANPQGVKQVTLTGDAARRISLQTARVTASGGGVVVPYAALIYDKLGKSWVYVVTGPLTYLRVSVVVEREVPEDRMLLSAGPRAGTEVVTVGATQVYGAELGMDGNH